MESTYDDEKRQAYLSSGQIIYAFHKSTDCYGEFCPVHKPSNHSLRAYDLDYDFEVGSFFRNVDGRMEVDPDDYILNNTGKVIITNAIRCLKCGTLAVSMNRHDMCYCKCGAVAADGGSVYLRRLGAPGDFEDVSSVYYK